MAGAAVDGSGVYGARERQALGTADSDGGKTVSTALSELEAFRDAHDPCDEAIEWVKRDNIQSLAEAWDKARPEWLIWMATREGVLSERQQQMFRCWCVRQIWHLLTDERSRRAVEVAERYAIGEATDEELAAALVAARAATRAAEMTAAWDAALAAQADYLRPLNPYRGDA